MSPDKTKGDFMKSILILAAAMSASLSAFAGYTGLPRYTTNVTSQDIVISDDTAAVQNKMDKCKAEIDLQKNILLKKGYAIVEESACGVTGSVDNKVFVSGSFSFLK